MLNKSYGRLFIFLGRGAPPQKKKVGRRNILKLMENQIFPIFSSELWSFLCWKYGQFSMNFHYNFDPRQQKVVFVAILVPQSNTYVQT